MEPLCIAGLLVGVIGLLVTYGRATVETLKEIGLVNPLTVSLAVIVLIYVVVEWLR